MKVFFAHTWQAKKIIMSGKIYVGTEYRAHCCNELSRRFASPKLCSSALYDYLFIYCQKSLCCIPSFSLPLGFRIPLLLFCLVFSFPFYHNKRNTKCNSPLTALWELPNVYPKKLVYFSWPHWGPKWSIRKSIFSLSMDRVGNKELVVWVINTKKPEPTIGCFEQRRRRLPLMYSIGSPHWCSELVRRQPKWWKGDPWSIVSTLAIGNNRIRSMASTCHWCSKWMESEKAGIQVL